MTDDTTPTDEGETDTIDVRTDDDKQVDNELDALLDEYERQKDSDEPVDENLQQLAEKHAATAPGVDSGGGADGSRLSPGGEATFDDLDADGDTDPPETGETTVRIGDEVDPDEADFTDDPSGDEIEAAAASEQAKAKRRAERDTDGDGTRSAGDQTGGPGDALDDATTVSDLADEYDIDADNAEATESDAAHDAEPNVDVEELGPTAAGDVASYEDVAEEGVLPEVDVDEDFDFEDQDPDNVSDRPDPRTIALPSKGDEPLYVRLDAPDDDACINIVERMQQAPGLQERMEVVVANVVAKPTWVPDEMNDWPFGVRMSLFGECTRQLGLDDLQDFQ